MFAGCYWERGITLGYHGWILKIFVSLRFITFFLQVYEAASITYQTLLGIYPLQWNRWEYIYIRNVCESEGLFPFVSRCWMSTCYFNCGWNALKKVFADSITMLKYTAKSSGNDIIFMAHFYDPLLVVLVLGIKQTDGPSWCHEHNSLPFKASGCVMRFHLHGSCYCQFPTCFWAHGPSVVRHVFFAIPYRVFGLVIHPA